MAAVNNLTEIVEHIVIFKVKPDVDPSKVPAMLNSINGLVSLDTVHTLGASPLIRCLSSSYTFTHALHCRFASKADFDKFYSDPDHHVVINETKPLFEDILAVDWAHLTEMVAIPPGSALRVTFFKLKKNLEEKEKSEVLAVIGGLKEKFPSIQEQSIGENNSPARAKGFSIVSIVVFKDVSELEAFVAEWEGQRDGYRNLVKDKLEETMGIEFVLP